MAGRLAGKVALISGGGRGQGAEEARLFVKEGAAVVLGDILVEEGQKVAADLRAQGGQATFIKLDVTQEQAWRQAVETATRTYGKLSILVNNAGIFPIEGVEATNMELWNRVIAINQTGVWVGMTPAIPAMRLNRGGAMMSWDLGPYFAYHGLKASSKIGVLSTVVPTPPSSTGDCATIARTELFEGGVGTWHSMTAPPGPA